MIALTAEFQKARRSFALWLSVVGTLANGLIFWLLFVLEADLGILSVAGDASPWKSYVLLHFQGIAFMMLPLYVIILCSLINLQEHTSGTRPQLFTLPMNRWPLYWGKQLYILLHFVLAHLLFIALMLLSGLLTGLLFPDSGLLQDTPPWMDIVGLGLRTTLSVLGLLAFHHWFSWRFPSFIVGLTVGIIGFVLASLLGPEWSGAPLFWYATPILYMPAITGTIAIPSFGGMELHLWVSLAWFGLFTVLGYLDIRQRDLG